MGDWGLGRASKSTNLSRSGAFPLDVISPKLLYPCLGLPRGNQASRSWGATAS
ncbi:MULTISPECIES: hypothetical protein [Moorena]|uniref:Uncharacterized protein n=1 Tax=Moorena producens 3L TaxID=489825 RepID=F4XJU9_9CYAN|nr:MULTISPECIES: hypothetical protein [Moorena]NEQ14181.1 hypothetical protein [Moorena sp. SIO3E2]EGJ35379.1 hypothetical protein LYNGBM3L_07250 [Moorena producens 3L]NEP32819.1 hypothetical protein [Moorena sp. SIO3B2]NEP63992.1 hypothetical protein [Moorena sp. SIO3A5]NEQ06181.1 hypothetical protein [Moorena sp. SIO4E2]